MFSPTSTIQKARPSFKKTSFIIPSTWLRSEIFGTGSFDKAMLSGLIRTLRGVILHFQNSILTLIVITKRRIACFINRILERTSTITDHTSRPREYQQQVLFEPTLSHSCPSFVTNKWAHTDHPIIFRAFGPLT